jgi:cation diffusion facilitator family transporter
MTDFTTGETKAGVRITLVGVVANAVMIALKFFGGFVGHSQALIADAVHSISDLFTDAVVLYGLKAGRKRPDRDHPFGHARIETMASAFVGLVLVGVAFFLGIEAAENIFHHRESQPTWMAVGVALLAIVAKEVLFQYTIRVGRRIQSPVISANAWHHRSDALSSLAVLVGVTGARIRPQWHILDAYAALLVSLFIAKAGVEILRGAARELTDTAPPPSVLNQIEQMIRQVPGVMTHHDLRVRTSGGWIQMEVHIVVSGELSVARGHRISKAVEKKLKEEIQTINQVTIHVDPDRDQEPSEGP